MDAIIGRYRVRMEETGLLLRHTSGINFDLAPNEALSLLDFLSAYRQNLQNLITTQRDTDPHIERVTINEDDEGDK